MARVLVATALTFSAACGAQTADPPGPAPTTTVAPPDPHPAATTSTVPPTVASSGMTTSAPPESRLVEAVDRSRVLVDGQRRVEPPKLPASQVRTAGRERVKAIDA